MKNRELVNHFRKKESYLSYKNMPHEFRPYLMFVNFPNYKTKHINTDEFGFRITVNKKHELYNLRKLKELKRCNVLVGGSVAFGQGASSDSKTISSEMSHDEIICQNLGVRAATSQQELLIFQNFKRYLPKIDNLYIFTGINDLVLASQESTFFYPEFGGVYSEDLRFNLFWEQYSVFNNNKWEKGKNNFFNIIDHLIKNYSIIKNFFSLLSYILPEKKRLKNLHKLKNLTYEDKVFFLRELIKNDIKTWKALSDQLNFKITYILQPCVAWTNKKLTEEEKFVFENQKSTHDFFDKLLKKSNYINHKNFLIENCKNNNIKFIDMNVEIDSLSDKNSFFYDFCHLTDFGNKCVASILLNLSKN